MADTSPLANSPPGGPELGPEDGEEAWLPRLRDDEKVALLSGCGMWEAGGVPRLGLPPLRVSDGPHGPRGCGLRGNAGAALAPCELALAATFDESLIEEVGAFLGEECAKAGAHVLLGPCLNLQRLPTFGRHFECFSEDAHLTSRAAVAYVRGVQRHVGACAKHLVGNDQETNRHTMNSVIEERTLREIYLAPFEAAAVEAGVESMMCGYNRLNGTFCTENPWLLQRILRDEWGWRGFIVSDWYGNRSTLPALRAGLNLEMPGIEPMYFGGYLREAVHNNDVPTDLLDERCRPVLRTVLRRATRGSGAAETAATSNSSRRRDLLRRAASRSMVLMKNESRTLPLNAASLRRIAVIGPNASETVIQGGGSARVRPQQCCSFLEAMRHALPSTVELVHEKGCIGWEERVVTPELAALMMVGSCDRTGRPAWAPWFMTCVSDGFLKLAAPICGNECFRKRCMPLLRCLGVRQPTVDEIVAQLAAKAARGEKSACSDMPSIPWGSLILTGLAILVLWNHIPANFRLAAVAAGFALTFLILPVRRQLQRRADESAITLAARAAESADAVVLVLGTDGHWESEGAEQPHMRLPGRQNELVQSVATVARGPVIVILNVGSPKELPWLESVNAVLLAHYGGEEMAPALIDLLLGTASPTGRLPTTWLHRLEDSPAVFASATADSPAAAPGDSVYREGLGVGYRGLNPEVPPVFPFGHGLTYTQFEYGPLEAQVSLESSSDRPGPRCSAQLRVRNVGERVGLEVVQLYVKDGSTPQTLRGFACTAELPPGGDALVSFNLGPRALGSWYDPAIGEWRVPSKGAVLKLRVGSSSSDIRTELAVKIP